MRALQGIGNLVLVAMASASLVIMVAAYFADIMVNGDLYYYGLHFNVDWYIPFKNVIGVVYAMAWVNIIIAIGFQVYRIRTIRKDQIQSANEELEKTLKSTSRQKNRDPDDEERKVYGIAIVGGQAAIQEAKEQVLIVPYKPEIREQPESKVSEQAEE
jgi:hypothetical protein